MVTLSELTTTELGYLRSKWNSEVTELNKEKARKRSRLDDRLSRQAEDGTALTVLEASLAHAEAGLAHMVSTGADAELITNQQSVVDDLQAQIDNFSTSASYLSNPDALLVQMELDELEQDKILRTAKIAEITTLLGG